MYRSEGVVNCRRGGRSTATQSQLVVELGSRESSSQTRGTEELSRSSNLSQDGLHSVRGSRREKKIDSSLERYRRTRFSLAQESSVKKGKGAAISDLELARKLDMWPRQAGDEPRLALQDQQQEEEEEPTQQERGGVDRAGNMCDMLRPSSAAESERAECQGLQTREEMKWCLDLAVLEHDDSVSEVDSVGDVVLAIELEQGVRVEGVLVAVEGATEEDGVKLPQRCF
ncbi:hypothetical protein BHE74_00013781 [Ensete ventricosum]|nr:hypothetical protein BHE74_00013781 [Ensete ventricosum]